MLTLYEDLRTSGAEPHLVEVSRLQTFLVSIHVLKLLILEHDIYINKVAVCLYVCPEHFPL